MSGCGTVSTATTRLAIGIWGGRAILDEILDDAHLDDAVVEVGRELPIEVAKKVLASAGFAEAR